MAKITLAAARTNLGLTQAGLADKMGVSRETVVAWETGKRQMRTPYLKLFCDLTGFHEDEILLPLKSAESVSEGA